MFSGLLYQVSVACQRRSATRHVFNLSNIMTVISTLDRSSASTIISRQGNKHKLRLPVSARPINQGSE